MRDLVRFFVNKPKQYQMLIGVGVVILTAYCATISYAKIDPKTVAGIWLFDEGNGKTTKDLSGLESALKR